MPGLAATAAVAWLSCLRLWGVPATAFGDGTPPRPALEIRSVHGTIVRVSGDHFPPREPIWLSIDEYRDRFTDCRGDDVIVHADRRGRVSARLPIPRCALHLCDAHTETLGATADFACGSDCGWTAVTTFACLAR